VIEILNRNTRVAQEAVRNLARSWKAERECECGSALAGALITDPSRIPPETLKRLDLLVSKYLK
jgi:5'-methylthioadenosine phosphorylase